MPRPALPCGIALLGCGTVGSGVAAALLARSEALAARAGRSLNLVGIAVKNPNRTRPIRLPGELLTANATSLVQDPAVNIVVELIGGLEPARTLILQALAAGKDIVTANKAVLAEHGDELFAAAVHHGRTLCFEASVAGGIPLIVALTQGLVVNRIHAVKAILNGTSNFILSKMTAEGGPYAEALAEAQRLGFAEADPTMDVDGTDSAQKLAILARLAFGASVRGIEIERRGIGDIAALDIHYAAELGYVIKLLAEAWEEEDQLALHVEPTLVRRHEALAEVHGANNAVEIDGDLVGAIFFAGPGAGPAPTTSAVLADLIGLANGSAALVFQSRHGWQVTRTLPRRSPAQIQSRFYLRIPVRQQVGVLAEVDGLLACQGISIASVVSHEGEGTNSVVVVTRSTNLAALRQAVAAMPRLSCSAGPPTHYPIAD